MSSLFLPLNNATTANDYVERCTLRAPGANNFDFDIANAAIYVSFGEGVGGILWGPETFIPPGFRSLRRRADAVRVRSAVAGNAAQVTIDASP
jgi:hypothetical protein